jgi:prefoldin alpha subunit
MEKDKVQQKYMELQLLNQQIKQSQSQLEALQQQLAELTNLNQNLEDFKDIKTGSEALVQISNGIFTKAVIKDNKDVIVNIGADIAVKKDVPSTKKLVEAQMEEIKKVHQQRMEELQMTAMKASLLEKEISGAAEKRG